MHEPIEQRIAERARHQTEMSILMLKIREENVRHDAATALGHRSENEAKSSVTRFTTPATESEIIAAIEELQHVKGKTYPKEPRFARIHETLLQARITRAALDIWLRECLRTTFCSGNKYQPLPTHDEAWGIYSKVYTDTTPQRYAAETLRCTGPVKITDAELVRAAEWGFWADMPLSLHRRLYQLMPAGKRQEIYATCTADEALLETRKHYDKTYA